MSNNILPLPFYLLPKIIPYISTVITEFNTRTQNNTSSIESDKYIHKHCDIYIKQKFPSLNCSKELFKSFHTTFLRNVKEECKHIDDIIPLPFDFLPNILPYICTVSTEIDCLTNQNHEQNIEAHNYIEQGYNSYIKDEFPTLECNYKLLICFRNTFLQKVKEECDTNIITTTTTTLDNERNKDTMVTTTDITNKKSNETTVTISSETASNNDTVKSDNMKTGTTSDPDKRNKQSNETTMKTDKPIFTTLAMTTVHANITNKESSETTVHVDRTNKESSETTVTIESKKNSVKDTNPFFIQEKQTESANLEKTNKKRSRTEEESFVTIPSKRIKTVYETKYVIQNIRNIPDAITKYSQNFKCSRSNDNTLTLIRPSMINDRKKKHYFRICSCFKEQNDHNRLKNESSCYLHMLRFVQKQTNPLQICVQYQQHTMNEMIQHFIPICNNDNSNIIIINETNEIVSPESSELISPTSSLQQRHTKKNTDSDDESWDPGTNQDKYTSVEIITPRRSQRQLITNSSTTTKKPTQSSNVKHALFLQEDNNRNTGILHHHHNDLFSSIIKSAYMTPAPNPGPSRMTDLSSLIFVCSAKLLSWCSTKKCTLNANNKTVVDENGETIDIALFLEVLNQYKTKFDISEETLREEYCEIQDKYNNMQTWSLSDTEIEEILNFEFTTHTIMKNNHVKLVSNCFPTRFGFHSTQKPTIDTDTISYIRAQLTYKNHSYTRNLNGIYESPVFTNMNFTENTKQNLLKVLFSDNGALNENVLKCVSPQNMAYIMFEDQPIPKRKHLMDQRFMINFFDSGSTDERELCTAIESMLTENGLFDANEQEIQEIVLIIGGTNNQPLHFDIARTFAYYSFTEKSTQKNMITCELNRNKYNDMVTTKFPASTVIMDVTNNNPCFYLGMQKSLLQVDDNNVCHFLGDKQKQKYQIISTISEDKVVLKLTCDAINMVGDCPHFGVSNIQPQQPYFQTKMDILKNLSTLSQNQSQIQTTIPTYLSKCENLNQVSRLFFKIFPTNAPKHHLILKSDNVGVLEGGDIAWNLDIFDNWVSLEIGTFFQYTEQQKAKTFDEQNNKQYILMWNEENSTKSLITSGQKRIRVQATNYVLGKMFAYEDFVEAKIKANNILPMIKLLNPTNQIKDFLACQAFKGINYVSFLTLRDQAWLSDVILQEFIDIMNLQQINNKFLFIYANTLTNILSRNKVLPLYVDEINKRNNIVFVVYEQNHFWIVEITDIQQHIKNNEWKLTLVDTLCNSKKTSNKRLQQSKYHQIENFMTRIADLKCTWGTTEFCPTQQNDYDCGIEVLRRIYFQTVFQESVCDGYRATQLEQYVPKSKLFRLIIMETILDNNKPLNDYFIHENDKYINKKPLENYENLDTFRKYKIEKKILNKTDITTTQIYININYVEQQKLNEEDHQQQHIDVI